MKVSRIIQSSASFFSPPPIFKQHRVVVTGLGAVTPLGIDVNTTWNRLINGECGIKHIKAYDATKSQVQIAAEVPRFKEGITENENEKKFKMEDYVSKKDWSSQSVDFIAFAMSAALQALEDANWKPESDIDTIRTGITMGAGMGNLTDMVQSGIMLKEGKGRRISPFFIPRVLINLAGGHLSIKHNLRGPNHSCVTACATGSHSIGDAFRMIQRGDADVMVAGGTEASINELTVLGFTKAKALTSKFNENPTMASRPFDADRCGFVIGEGAGALILENYEHAVKRGAKIYAEIRGYGMSADAYHMTAPREDGDGAYRAMKMTIEQSGLRYDQIDYINAHGTSTPLGDAMENKAIKALFGENAKNLAVSSTKGAIGHLLGAAGAVEAVIAIKALEEKILPPTLNLNNKTEEFTLNYVPLEAQKKQRVDAVMSNSFGFGGTNACLCFARI